MSGFEPSKKYPIPGLEKMAEALKMLSHYVKEFEIAQSIINNS
jgi:hypothetical protein